MLTNLRNVEDSADYGDSADDMELTQVLAEPCLRFQDDADAPSGPCLACGWLGDDHTVVPLEAVRFRTPRRGRGSTRPQARRAS